MAYSPEIKQAARALYLKAWTPKEITKELSLGNERIVYYWADKHGWRDMLREHTVDEAISTRIQALLEIPEPSPAQLKLLDCLINHHVKLKKMRANDEKQAQSKEAKQQSSGSNRSSGKSNKKQKKGKNNVEHLEADDFNDWNGSLFKYQIKMRNNIKQRIRNIL